MRTQDFSQFYGRLEIQGQITLMTPLRIGTGGGDEMGLADISVVKDALGRPFIPGSSFKGVLRAYLESVLRAIDSTGEKNLACLCVTYEDNPRCPTTLRQDALKERVNLLKKSANDLNGKDGPYLDQIYLEDTCRICQVFGSPGLASKLQVPDLMLAEEWIGRYQIRHGVSIERDTETAADQRLFTSEAVPAGTVFNSRLILENGSLADQGLTFLGLKALERELITLGGGTSRGLGRVKFTQTDCWEVRPDNLIDFLVTGAKTKVETADITQKIQAFRTNLRMEWGVAHA